MSSSSSNFPERVLQVRVMRCYGKWCQVTVVKAPKYGAGVLVCYFFVPYIKPPIAPTNVVISAIRLFAKSGSSLSFIPK